VKTGYAQFFALSMESRGTPRLLQDLESLHPPYTRDDIFIFGGPKYHPFSRWCYEHYLNPEDGVAVFALPVEADFETFPFEETFETQMQERFPKHQVIVSPFFDARYI